MLPIKAILHPTDFSDASEHALRMAVGLARDYHARLVLLHAIEPPVYYGELGMAVLPTEVDRDNATRRVAALVAGATPFPVETVVTEGVAGPEVLRVAAEMHADLIVIGSHGRTGFGRALMGSVAEEVSRRSPCPVVIVRSPHEIAAEVEEPSEAAARST